MSGYAVDLELVEELVSQMVAFERHLDDVHHAVGQRAQRVHAVWQGVAAADSVDAHARWANGARDMHEALAVLRSIAATARENYSAALAANARMWAM